MMPTYLYRNNTYIFIENIYKQNQGEKMNGLINALLNKRYAYTAFAMLIVFLCVEQTFAQATSGSDKDLMNTATNQINKVLCKLASLIFFTAGAIASLVIIMAGLRWVTSSDDPGARQAAKTTIISAFVGLIIIMIAVYIVAIVINGILPDSNIKPTYWLSGSCGGGSSSGGGCSGTCYLDAASCTSTGGSAGTGACTADPQYPYCCSK